jgi:hypothetical protein
MSEDRFMEDLIEHDVCYEKAIEEIERLWDSIPGSEDGKRFIQLVDQVVEYEKLRWPIET